MREGIAALGVAATLLGPLVAPAQGASLGAVVLTWTAPGDDGLTGKATAYDLRRSTTMITDANFLNATRVLLPAPSIPGIKERFILSGLDIGKFYYFSIRTVDDVGNWSGLSNTLFKQAVDPTITPVGVEQVPRLSFSPPWPNPSRQSVSFEVELPAAGSVAAEVFDALGRRVRTLASGTYPAGENRLIWDLRDDHGSRLGAGIYIVRAAIGGTHFTRRVVVSG